MPVISSELRSRYEDLRRGWQETPHGVTFSMEEVQSFCATVGDPNPIHTRDYSHPIIPGLLELAALGRYLQSRPPVFIDGFQTTISSISARFKNLVMIGTPLSLRYRATDLRHGELGAAIDAAFEVVAPRTRDVILEGDMTLQFIRDRVFKHLAMRAIK